MNPYTGELRRIAPETSEPDMSEDFINALKGEGFMQVPDDLKDAADKELGDKESVTLPQDHPLVQEMRKRANEKAKKKKRAKIAKKSKRRNR
jgi:hypothetical protein